MVKHINRIVGFETRKKAIEHRNRYNKRKRVNYGWSPKYKHFYEYHGKE